MNVQSGFLTPPESIVEAAGVCSGSSPRWSASSFFAWLIAEHSPIRRVVLSWRLKRIPYWVSVHFARHVHTQHFVRSSRTDKTHRDRSPNDLVDHLMDSNCQALIEMGRKRLCFKASPETREAMEALKAELATSLESDKQTLASVLVPNCVYRCGCPEIGLSSSCGLWAKLVDQTPALALINIGDRYRAYNLYFEGAHL